MLPHATVYKPDGSVLGFCADADSNAARGQALQDAKTAAASGDTIVVRAGKYDTKDLLKNGVNWECIEGVVIEYTGTANGAILDDNGALVSCRITGQGIFSRKGTGTNAAAIRLTHKDTALVVEGEEFKNDNGTCIICDKSELTLTARLVDAAAGDGVLIKGGSLAGEQAKVIANLAVLSARDNGLKIENANVEHSDLYAARIITTNHDAINIVDGSGLPVFITAAEVHTGDTSVIGSGVVTADLIQTTKSGAEAVHLGANAGDGRVVGARIVSTAGPACQMIGGRLESCIVESKWNNSGGHAVKLNAGAGGESPKIIQNSVLLTAHASANSIANVTGGGTLTVKSYPSVLSPRNVGSNVAQQVGTVTVDSNVT